MTGGRQAALPGHHGQRYVLRTGDSLSGIECAVNQLAQAMSKSFTARMAANPLLRFLTGTMNHKIDDVIIGCFKLTKLPTQIG